MKVFHLSDDPQFTPDPAKTVIGWGVKNHGPCEAMTGVLYVAENPARWTGHRLWGSRQHLIEFDLSGTEGVDFVRFDETETLVLNLDALSRA